MAEHRSRHAGRLSGGHLPARALIVCPEPPYPLRGGGALRTAALLHYLASRYTLDAILFAEPHRPDPRLALPPGLVSRSLLVRLPAHGKGFFQRGLRNLGRLTRGMPPLLDRFHGFAGQIAPFLSGCQWDLAVVEHLWCAPYADLLRRHCSRLILDLHNIESVWHRRLAAQSPWPLSAAHRRFTASALRFERECSAQFDQVLVTSQDDAAFVAAALVYPNTVPDRPRPECAKLNRIAFSGNWDYQPNQAAARWFARDIWPALRDRHLGLEWVLVGRAPDAVRSIARDPRILLTGEVTDAVAEIARAKAAVVPILTGSGTRVKILEAWCAGTAVVSTSLGAEGLPREGVAVADTAASFVSAVSGLLHHDQGRTALENRGRALLEEKFTWQAGWKLLADLGI